MYKACKQTKPRAHRHMFLNKIQEAFNLNNNGMWRILSEASNPSVDGDMPSPTEFYDMFYELSLPREVNRHILFFKLIKSRFHGRVIDTLRSLYKKTNFMVKIGGKLSSLIKDERGVNQGGNASPTIYCRSW